MIYKYINTIVNLLKESYIIISDLLFSSKNASTTKHFTIDQIKIHDDDVGGKKSRGQKNYFSKIIIYTLCSTFIIHN